LLLSLLLSLLLLLLLPSTRTWPDLREEKQRVSDRYAGALATSDLEI
jgi:hypothetical protein